jgi:transposase
MLAFPAGFKIHLAVAPVDMRKQFNGLWAAAEQTLRMDPRQGAVFVFANKTRDRVKLLYWDGTGVWVLAKRLEKGRFNWPREPGAARLALTPEALTMLLAGIDLKDGMRRAWYEAPP